MRKVRRAKVCGHPLAPRARSDAKFCSDACRQADYRQRNLLAANLVFTKTQVDAGRASERYDDYRALAVDLHTRATTRSIEDVRFIATPRGVIVTGNYGPWKPDPISVMRATEYDAGDPKIVEAILQRQSADGSSFHRKQHEDGDADTIQSDEQRVLLLEFHDEVSLRLQLGRRVSRDPDADWLRSNYHEGERLWLELTRDHGSTDTDSNQDIAKELSQDDPGEGQHNEVDENAEGDGAQHRNDEDDKADEDDEDQADEAADEADPK